jgi:Tol biopolymer transport system component
VKRRKILLRLVSLFVLLSGCIPLPLAPPKFDPSLKWKTLETPHFSIHFHQGEEAVAAEAARHAEEAHTRLTQRLHWTPSGKTQMVLIDHADRVQGEATPFPYNTITINPYPPAAGILTPIRYENWLRAILFHEYTHIIQLDQAHGLPKVFRYFFGRVVLPNVWQPLWLLEGLATFEESEAGTTDRSDGTFSEMLLRTAILEDRFKSIDQAHLPDSWPAGMTPYYYGAAFHRFLNERYGAEKIAEWSNRYSARLIPFFIESNAENVLGRRLGPLWWEWKDSLREKYRRDAARLREEGITPTHTLSRSDFWKLAPVPSPDGKKIAYTEINRREYPRIKFLSVEGESGIEEPLENESIKRNSDAGLSWSPDGKSILFSQMEVVGNFSTYSDLYRFDLEERKLRRLTRGLRAKDPDFSPDGQRIVFVRQDVDRSVLSIWEEGKSRPLLSGEREQFFATPRWSPDGRRIVLSVWRGGNQDIALYDLDANRLERLMEDAALDLTPVWSPDGEVLLFVSDREGIFDLYAYPLSDRQFYRITRLLGGAFTPFVSPDSKSILFSSYHADGFAMAAIPYDRSTWKAVSIGAPSGRSETASREDATPLEAAGPVHSYFEPATLLPRFWVPLFGADEEGLTVGALTGGVDPLGKDRYLVNLSYGSQSDRLSYQIDYWNDHFSPTLHFQWLDRADPHGDLLVDPDGDEKTYWERNRRFRVETIFPFLAFRRQSYLSVGYQREGLTSLTDLGASLVIPEEGVLSGLRLSWIYNSAHEYGFSVSPEEGRRLFLTQEIFRRRFGGDFNRHRTIGGWREYYNLPWPNQVLAAQLSGGLARGDLLVQRSFQLGGLTAPFADFQEEPFLLRGYPAREFRGERAFSLSAEYRFPLRNVERGWGTLPFFIRRLHATFFGDLGDAWNEGEGGPSLKSGIGGSLGTDLYLGYYLPVRLQGGVARGLSDEGMTVVFLTLGNAF